MAAGDGAAGGGRREAQVEALEDGRRRAAGGQVCGARRLVCRERDDLLDVVVQRSLDHILCCNKPKRLGWCRMTCTRVCKHARTSKEIRQHTLHWVIFGSWDLFDGGGVYDVVDAFEDLAQPLLVAHVSDHKAYDGDLIGRELALQLVVEVELFQLIPASRSDPAARVVEQGSYRLKMMRRLTRKVRKTVRTKAFPNEPVPPVISILLSLKST